MREKNIKKYIKIGKKYKEKPMFVYIIKPNLI